MLAIRTIELLRASALKLLVESSRPASPPPPAPRPVIVASPAVAARPPRHRWLGLETGLSVIDSVGGPGAAAAPLARLRVDLGGTFCARLTAAGLGTRPSVETSLGSAEVGQSLALAELCALFAQGRRLRPFVSLGAGALRVQSDGEAVAPYQGNRNDRWAAVADGGVGLLAALGDELSVSLEAHLFLASPYPVVRFVDMNAATIGRPALMATLTLVAWP